MNPFINPITGLPFLKSYLSDPKRLHRHTFEEICKYRDRVLRKAVRYAYSVPVYHNKYKKSGVKPEDIKTINDKIDNINDILEDALNGETKKE